MREEYIETVRLKLIEENIISEKEITKDIKTKTDVLTFKCKECGNRFESTIKNLMDIRRKARLCLRCASRENFTKRLYQLYNENPYIFKSEFLSYDDELVVECKTCGDIFSVKNAKTLLLNKNLPDGAHPCKKCSENRRLKTYDISELENYLIEKFGECNYIFPEKEKYSGLYSKKKFKIKCKKCGHEMETLINNIINPSNEKHYCRVCNNKDRLLERMDYKERCLITTNGTIEPIEDYIDSKTAIKHKCNVCGYGAKGEWLKIPVKNTLRNAGCPVCTGNITVSSAENEIYNFIKSIYTGTVETKNRTILDKKEIDIFIPELNIGFEIDGLYWHSEKYKGKNYHIDKTREALKKNVRLVHIFEDEWYQKRDICQNKIKNILGCAKTNRIYARKCKVITNISSKVKNEFLEKFHIQGKDNASIILGLEYNNEIVAIMTFVSPRISLGRKKGDLYEYELSRFATSTNIIGGFSKLLSFAIKNNPIKVINTYADFRWSSMTDNVYLKNGFKYVRLSLPGYWYFNSHEPSRSVVRHHRFGFRKQLLEEKFPDFYDPELTEFKIMDKTNYSRIWDCGNLVYRLEVDDAE